MSQRVEVDRSDLVEVYRTLNLIVVSLASCGSWMAGQRPEDAAAGLMRLHEDLDFFGLLAAARHSLNAYFDHTVGHDDMDELERELADEDRYWVPPS